ncbi:unnamed protein product [Rotaria magnacalcarata]|uniref:RRM domain-containing protein n=1 Tax=Rotaria magnacalcarata TaxID=392030 RepID=A0A819UX86_9BILA|nr:unnamed protein product [Rotaria magnacalcarata]CAF4102104.1 unnamed protein product [Rotaria magnacalcarata]
MDEQLSTSPDSIFSQLSSRDTASNGGIIPTLSALSVLSPLRSSVTLANMNNLTYAQENQSFFHDDFNSQKPFTISRWQSDGENVSLPYHSSNSQSSFSANYLMNEFLTNRNIGSSSLTDPIVSPMSRLSTSSSVMSLNSIGNQNPIGQRSLRSTKNSSADQFSVPNENINLFSSASAFLPLPTPISKRQTLSSIDNIHLASADNDLQRVPPSFMFMQPASTYANGSILHSQPQPQVVHSTTRSNTMPTWRGHLPVVMESYQTPTNFSQKVFLGGIPAELSEAELLLVLRKFGKCNIKWPKNDGVKSNMPSFCHVVYRESRSVGELLKHCTRQQRSTVDYFLHIHMLPSSTDFSIRTTRFKPIQVVPWNMKDNAYAVQQKNASNTETPYKDWSRTIFVSPLHGKMTAFSLGSIMSTVFGAVSMAQINTDKYGYPTGTGTVLFYDSHSYMRAVAAGAIDIKCDCFHKLLDIDPFLRENEPCAFCPSVADAFCRNFHCLRSYCKQCWVNRHGPKPLADHQPATRRQQPLPHM